MGELFVVSVLAGLYLLPTVIAAMFKHEKTTPLFLMNLLFGWIIFVWLAALIWAFVGPHEKSA